MYRFLLLLAKDYSCFSFGTKGKATVPALLVLASERWVEESVSSRWSFMVGSGNQTHSLINAVVILGAHAKSKPRGLDPWVTTWSEAKRLGICCMIENNSCCTKRLWFEVCFFTTWLWPSRPQYETVHQLLQPPRLHPICCYSDWYRNGHRW